jgi:hypothetical protein
MARQKEKKKQEEGNKEISSANDHWLTRQRASKQSPNREGSRKLQSLVREATVSTQTTRSLARVPAAFTLFWPGRPRRRDPFSMSSIRAE